MTKSVSEAARKALTETDWVGVDAFTDADIARQIAANPDAAPDMASEIDDAADGRTLTDHCKSFLKRP
jgi:putative transcriptional regulator